MRTTAGPLNSEEEQERRNTLCKKKAGNESPAALRDIHPALRSQLLLHLPSQSIFSTKHCADSSCTGSAAAVTGQSISKAWPVLNVSNASKSQTGSSASTSLQELVNLRTHSAVTISLNTCKSKMFSGLKKFYFIKLPLTA